MKKLMFIAVVLAAGISFAADYSPSGLPANTNQPDVMPGQVNFQGLLRDPATGNPYADGIYTLECRLYTALTGTKAIWGAKYQAYVREGYFNIMLGSTGTPLSGCTYAKPEDLWKALWYSGDNRELYLGVTPWHGADGQTIADADKRKEITPRQQLLAAPFALRAQKAQYADAAVKNFNVPGDLTVTGQIKNSDGTAFGLKNIKTDVTGIEIGTSTTVPSKTVMQGEDVAITSGDELNLNPGGEMKVSLAAGKTMTVDGNDGHVYFKNFNTFDSTADFFNVYSGSIYLGWDKSSNHSFGMRISGGSETVTLEADCIDLRAHKKDESVYNASLSVCDDEVSGIGDMKWWMASAKKFNSPIVFRTVYVELPKNETQVSKSIATLINDSSLSVTDYAWSVVGYTFVQVNENETQWRSPELRRMRCRGVNLELGVDAYVGVSRFWLVQLMGVSKKWCDDARSDPEEYWKKYKD